MVILDARLELVLVKEPLIVSLVRVLITAALAPSEPLMSSANCADELTTEPSASASSAVILEARLEDTEVNEPLIVVLSKLLMTSAFEPNEPLMSAAN